jgi:hypothetical protein
MSNRNSKRWWSGDRALERITRAYSREDDQDRICPQCGDVAQQWSIQNNGNVVRELCCTNCGPIERTTAVKITETDIEVSTLPSKCRISGLNSSGEKLAVWLLYCDRCKEVAECQ